MPESILFYIFMSINFILKEITFLHLYNIPKTSHSSLKILRFFGNNGYKWFRLWGRTKWLRRKKRERPDAVTPETEYGTDHTS